MPRCTPQRNIDHHAKIKKPCKSYVHEFSSTPKQIMWYMWMKAPEGSLCYLIAFSLFSAHQSPNWWRAGNSVHTVWASRPRLFWEQQVPHCDPWTRTMESLASQSNDLHFLTILGVQLIHTLSASPLSGDLEFSSDAVRGFYLCDEPYHGISYPRSGESRATSILSRQRSPSSNARIPISFAQ